MARKRICPKCGHSYRTPTNARVPLYGNHQKPAKARREQEAIALMVQMRRDGMTFRGIAEKMQADGFSMRRSSGAWNPGTVKRIVNRAGVK